MAKVLVIDDDPGVRTAVRRILERGGHETVDAVNGQDGIDALIRSHFDLVITDLFMPDQDGITGIQRVRELDADIPIIAISGVGGTERFSPLHDAKEVGADLAITKPFTVEGLLAAVEALLSRGTV